MRDGIGVLAKLRASAGFVRIVRNWPDHYLATHGRRRPARLTYQLRNGLLLEARPRTLDVAVLKDVFWHQVYTPPGFAIGENETVLDVGAHIGAFAACAARAAPGVKVLAFEPSPENFALLASNMARNGLANVKLFPQALSGGAGPRELHLSRSPAGHSLHIAEPGAEHVSVPSLSLADVFEAHALQAVDLLKMDCEGAEYEILDAAMPAPLDRVRRIAMEAHTLDGPRTPARISALLEAQGFVVQSALKGDGTAMIWAKRPPAVLALP